jgi:penicillin-binding protein 2
MIIFNERRSFLIGCFQGITTIGLIGFLKKLQITDNIAYKLMSDKNRMAIRFCLSPRGNIVDRNNKIIATNTLSFRCIIRRENFSRFDSAIERLSNLKIIINKDINKKWKKLQKRDAHIFSLKEDLSWEDATTIELESDDLIEVESVPVRNYLNPILFTHITGYVSTPSGDKIYNGLHSKFPGLKVGKQGLELFYDNFLLGFPGKSQIEINAKGYLVKDVSKVNPRSGETLKVYISSELQEYVYECISQHKRGSAIVLKSNGEILAMVSYPSFDGSKFINGISSENWNKLLKDEDIPLLNRATLGVYPPGSIYKIIIAIAALHEKVIDKDTKMFCCGYYKLGEHKSHCWSRHGSVDLISAIRESCDVFFFELGRRLGVEKISYWSKILGLGEKVILDFDAEKRGLIPTKEWKKKVHKKSWQTIDSINLGIGQGYILTTPIQLACLGNTIWNGGRIIKPRFSESFCNNFSESKSDKFIEELNQDFLNIVKEGIEQVCCHPRGTAYDSEMLFRAGKTGSAQVKKISKADRKAGKLKSHNFEWEDREHALFLGIGPYENPEYTVMVIIEHGGSGAKCAAKIARDVMRKLKTLI